jgi:hypothetical protein
MVVTAGPPPVGMYDLVVSGRRQSVAEISPMSHTITWIERQLTPSAKT